MHVGLGGSYGNPQGSRDLFVAETERVSKHQHLPLFNRQTRELLGDLAAQVGDLGKPRGVRHPTRRIVDCRFERLRPSNLLASAYVTACIHDQPMQPSGEMRFASELTKPRAYLQERLLGRISRVLDVIEQPRCHLRHLGGVALDKRVKRKLITTVCTISEVGVTQAHVRSRKNGANRLADLSKASFSGLLPDRRLHGVSLVGETRVTTARAREHGSTDDYVGPTHDLPSHS